MENYNVTIKNVDTIDKYKVSVLNNLEEKILKYTEKDGTITSFDYEKNILRRDNDEMIIEFVFDKEEEIVEKIKHIIVEIRNIRSNKENL